MTGFDEIRQRFPKALKVVLVTDENVDRIYGDEVVRSVEAGGLIVDRVVVPPGEKTKSLESYAALVRAFAQFELARTDIAIALGGGVVSDLTGFAAATYMRGIEWVAVPTTLLAMVDASIGGKTGVDLPEGKNLIGAFWKPSEIIRDDRFLETLPAGEMRNGRAEMVKMRVLTGCELTVESCAREKEIIVGEDFREGGRRRLLNLGHTFGHAIEAASDYGVSHGEAIAEGMRIVAKDVPEVLDLLEEFPHIGYDREKVLKAVVNDKKRVGDKVMLVVPKGIGDCVIDETPIGELGSWI